MNCIGDDGANQLAATLRHENRTLEHLDIRFNDIGDTALFALRKAWEYTRSGESLLC